MKAIPETDQALTSQMIEKTVNQVVRDLAKTMSWALGLAVAFLTVCFGLIGWRRQKQFSTAINRVVTSLGDLQSLQGSPMMAGARTVDPETPRALPNNGSSPFADYQLDSIKGMIADCYWTAKDSYALWIWKNLDFTQRTELLESLPYMREYSASLGNVPEKQFPFFDHAYYLKPFKLFMTSQEDLVQVVQAYPSTWHKLSPLRQAELSLGLEEKLKCMSVPSNDSAQTNTFPASALRTLSVQGTWGNLKDEDERELLRNPELVPKQIRGQIKSLVWLSLLPEERIREKFEKLDAQSLASAWVGPEDMLTRLENYLPDKKKALLKGYKSRIPAQRESPAFIWLWEESLKDESAA
jgi:hypothetical protein